MDGHAHPSLPRRVMKDALCCCRKRQRYRRWRKAVGRSQKWTGEDDPVGDRRRYREVCVCVHACMCALSVNLQ